jgi:hypothetical protein
LIASDFAGTSKPKRFSRVAIGTANTAAATSWLCHDSRFALPQALKAIRLHIQFMFRFCSGTHQKPLWQINLYFDDRVQCANAAEFLERSRESRRRQMMEQLLEILNV